AGDRFVTVDARPVRTRSQLAEALSGDEAVWGDRQIEVEILRDDASRTLSWVPFPATRYREKEGPDGETPLRPGRLIDVYQQLDVTFAGYPLEFSEHCYLGTTHSEEALEVELPMGSYLLVLRLDGRDDLRYPLLVPSEESEVTVEIPPRERVPPGFVHVPRGPVEYGGDPEAYDPLDAGRVILGDFFIARHETTLGEWLEFVNAPEVRLHVDKKTGSAPPMRDWNSAALRALTPRPEEGIDTIQWIPFSVLRDDLLFRWDETEMRWKLKERIEPSWPLRGVSMLAGLEYAHWRTQESDGRWRFRLPTDLEWEKAARGVDRRPFVWGNYLLWTFCHSDFGWYSGRQPRPVGAYSTDESIYGVRDLAGSMKEPIPEQALPDHRLNVLRGGEWETVDRRDFHAASRNRRRPWLVFDFVGLRLAADFVKNP
ncbi:MAG: SUMF1/EgtB/PvdO family nonheme iron enzyme, partial [Planctomycetota bacterium]|nr:SUMF1/EgtB/PvdO family nonheme iron enzyme [Planctomycetota bacterium]